MKRFDHRMAVNMVIGAALVSVMAACGQTSATPVAIPSPLPTITAFPSPLATPPSPTATAVPPTPTPGTAAAKPTATPAVKLQTDIIEFTVPVSEDDMDPVIPAIHNLSGVTDVQAGGNGLQVTYDPSLVTRKQIVETIEGFGFHVKQ